MGFSFARWWAQNSGAVRRRVLLMQTGDALLRRSGQAGSDTEAARRNGERICELQNKHCGTSFCLVRRRLSDVRLRRPTNYAGTVRGMAIAVERCIVSRDLTEPKLSPDGRCVVFVLAAGGSAALHIDTLDGAPQRQLSAYPPPRAGRGFGGGCWCWSAEGDAVIYAATDGDLWLQPIPNGGVQRLTRHGPERVAAAPAVVGDGSRAVYVIDEAEVWAVRLDDHSTERLDDGSADFVFDPCATSDNRAVAWQAWNVPDMPWDASRMQRRGFGDADVDDVRCGG